MAKVITQNDLNDIIKSAVAISKSSITLVSEVMKVVHSTQIDNVDIKDIESFTKLMKPIADYMSNVSKTIISIDTIDFKRVISVSKNIRIIPYIVNDIVNSLIRTVNDVQKSGEFKQLVDVLIGNEEVFEDILEEELKQGNESIRDKKSKKKISKKLGLFDVIAKYFGIIKSITEFSDVGLMDFIKIKINLKLFQSQLKWIIESIQKTLQDVIDIGSSNQEKVEDCEKTLTLIFDIVKVVSKLPLYIPLLIIWNRAINIFIEGFQNLNLMMNALIEGKIHPKTMLSIQNYITNVKNILIEVKTLFGVVILLGLITIPALVSTKILLKSIPIIFITLNRILSIVQNFKGINVTQDINNISSIFKNLNQLFVNIILTGLLAVPTLAASILIVATLWAILLCIKVIIWTLELLPNKTIKDSRNTLLGLVGIFGSLILVSLETIILGMIIKNHILDILIGLGGFIMMLGVLWVALWIINKMPIGSILEATINLFLISGVILAIIMATILLILYCELIKKLEFMSIVNSLIFFGGILLLLIGISLILAGIGYVMLTPIGGAILVGVGSIMLILVTMMLVTGTIMKVVNDLEKLQNIKLDSKKIKKNISNIFKVIGNILGELNGKTLLKLIFKAPLMIKPLRTIRKIIKLLAKIAEKLKYVGEIQLGNNIGSKVQLIFETVFGKNDSDEFAIVPRIMKMEELGKKKRYVRKAKRVLRQVNGVVEQLSSITEGLNSIAKFDIKETDITNGIEKIFSIVSFVETSIDKYMLPDAQATARSQRRQLRQDRKKMRLTKKTLSRVDEVLMEIVDIVDGFNKIKDFKIEQEAIQTSISNIFTSINDFIKQIDGQSVGGSVDMSSKNFKNKLDALSRISDITKGFIHGPDEVQSHQTFIDNNIKFLEKINTVDIEKLRTTENLFGKMAQFSESINGNFEGLAETLNEKIAPLLEEFKEIMEGVGKKVDNSSSNISASISSSKNDNLTLKEQYDQIDREMPDADPQERDRLVQQRMMEQTRNQNNNMIGKLEELIRLFKQGTIKVTVS